MSHEYTCKDPPQNISKLNLTMYKKNYTTQSRGIHPRQANHMTISTNAEKVFDKI